MHSQRTSSGVTVRQNAFGRVGPAANTRINSEKLKYAASGAAQEEPDEEFPDKHRLPPETEPKIPRTPAVSKQPEPPSIFPEMPATSTDYSIEVLPEFAPQHQSVQTSPKSDQQASTGRESDNGSDLDHEIANAISLCSHRVFMVAGDSENPSVNADGASDPSAGLGDSRTAGASPPQAATETSQHGIQCMNRRMQKLTDRSQNAMNERDDVVTVLKRERRTTEAVRAIAKAERDKPVAMV